MRKREDSISPEIIVTDDGSHTLYLPEINEHYHSHYGAITESKHIFIDAGYKYCIKDPVRILEVGFGTGLNALLTAMEAEKEKKKTIYCSIEKYPLPSDVTNKLNYGALIGNESAEILKKIHLSGWNSSVAINSYFDLEKKVFDLTAEMINGTFDLIFFDAFGPDKQPDMWSERIFDNISEVSVTGTIFVTYSAKGTLKRMLRSRGYEVSLLPGPPGKRCITRAIKF